MRLGGPKRSAFKFTTALGQMANAERAFELGVSSQWRAADVTGQALRRLHRAHTAGRLRECDYDALRPENRKREDQSQEAAANDRAAEIPAIPDDRPETR